MDMTRIDLHTALTVGPVDPRIFGGFCEHMGRCVYEGIYDPTSSLADEHGCRTDVLDALDRLHMPVMRYPGGNFASGYHWLDGVGPQAERPTVRELAWQSIEPNQFGTNEFVALCRRLDWDPMLTVNLGTGTPEEARNWVEYCNSPTGTHFSDLRAEHGHPEPHAVGLWCLGNEMDGPWQLGHVPAEQYAVAAQQAAKMMKDVDRSIELVLCGSCSVDLPTYLQWDREVLERVGGLVDYISLHRYVGNPDDDTPGYLAVTAAIDSQIEEMDAVCRFVQGRRRSRKRAYLCFDEWNVWYKNRSPADVDGAGRFAPHLVEEVYNLEDALVVAGFLNSFIRHADVVKIANIAQIVNVIAPLQTRGDELLVQSIYHVLAMFSARREGTSLRLAIDGPISEASPHGPVPIIDASAIVDGDRLHVFLTNRGIDADAPVEIRPADRTIASLLDGEIVTADDPKAANSFDAPDVVVACPFDQAVVRDGRAIVSLPPLATAALTFTLA